VRRTPRNFYPILRRVRCTRNSLSHVDTLMITMILSSELSCEFPLYFTSGGPACQTCDVWRQCFRELANMEYLDLVVPIPRCSGNRISLSLLLELGPTWKSAREYTEYIYIRNIYSDCIDNYLVGSYPAFYFCHFYRGVGNFHVRGVDI